MKPSAPAAAALRDWLASVRLSEAQLPSDAEEDAYLLRRAQGLVDSVGEASRCQELFAAAVSRSAPSSAKADSSRAKAALARLQRTLRPWLLNYQPQQQQQPLPWRQLLEGFVQHVVGHAPASLRRTVCAVDVAELNRRAQVWLRAPTAVENRDGNISDMAADNTFYVDGLSGNAAVTGWDEEETGIVWPAGWEDQSATRKRPPANTSAAVAAKKRANTVADMTVGPAEPLPPERAFALLAQAAAEEQQETQAFEARLKSALQGGDREQTALSQPAGSPDSTGVVPVAEALDVSFLRERVEGNIMLTVKLQLTVDLSLVDTAGGAAPRALRAGIERSCAAVCCRHVVSYSSSGVIVELGFRPNQDLMDELMNV